jgi:transcriptional regulator with XRE-family HTH domain
MGTFARRKPQRLAEKLLMIRRAFGDSQNGLIRRLGLTDELTQSDISAFERSTREPPLYVLLKYSEAAQVWVNDFIDDNVELPEKLPCKVMTGGSRRKAVSQLKEKSPAKK